MKNLKHIPLSLLAMACLPANAALTVINESDLPATLVASTSAYSTLSPDSYVDLGSVLEPMEFVDMLMCIVSAAGAPLIANGEYIALADFALCGAGSDGSGTPVMSQMVVKSERSSASSAQSTKLWIDYASDPGQVQEIEFSASISAAPTDELPLGTWELNWDMQDPADDSGHIAASVVSGVPTVVFANTGAYDDEDIETLATVQWTGATTGIGRVSVGDPAVLSSFAFNDTHVEITTGGAATCYDIDDLFDTAYEYNLYTADGALVDIASELQFTVDATSSRGVLGSYRVGATTHYWVWIDGTDMDGLADGATTSVSNEAGDRFTITWDVDNGYASVASVAGAGGASLSFDDPILFTPSDSTVVPFKERNDEVDFGASDFETFGLVYNGPGRLSGIQWTESDGSWNPTMSFADGTKLTSTDGTDYYVKAVHVARAPTQDDGQCGSLASAVSSAQSLTLPTVSVISSNAVTMGTKPTITAEPRVIDGVEID